MPKPDPKPRRVLMSILLMIALVSFGSNRGQNIGTQADLRISSAAHGHLFIATDIKSVGQKRWEPGTTTLADPCNAALHVQLDFKKVAFVLPGSFGAGFLQIGCPQGRGPPVSGRFRC
jgi:hypothetical protein